jgi:RHS repeat-associated protein
VPDLPSSGTYQVYAKWTADETRATDARYSILHEGGTAEVSVNQRAGSDVPGGLWQYLGSYAFDPLNTPTVSLAANDNGSVAADAVRFVGGPDGATDIAYLHADHLGTPQAMTDANAQILWWRDQTPFGQTVAEGGFGSSPLRFPGQYADAESGLAYNYFRDYDPALGRYIQSDPIGLTGGLNTYGYVAGNPLRYIDPSGTAMPVGIDICQWFPSICYGPDKGGDGGGFCPAPGQDKKAACRKRCSELALPTSDYGISFFRCMLACQSDGKSGFDEWDEHFPL